MARLLYVHYFCDVIDVFNICYFRDVFGSFDAFTFMMAVGMFVITMMYSTWCL
jgi:hypothetical protein